MKKAAADEAARKKAANEAKAAKKKAADEAAPAKKADEEAALAMHSEEDEDGEKLAMASKLRFCEGVWKIQDAKLRTQGASERRISSERKRWLQLMLAEMEGQ